LRKKSNKLRLLVLMMFLISVCINSFPVVSFADNVTVNRCTVEIGSTAYDAIINPLQKTMTVYFEAAKAAESQLKTAVVNLDASEICTSGSVYDIYDLTSPVEFTFKNGEAYTLRAVKSTLGTFYDAEGAVIDESGTPSANGDNALWRMPAKAGGTTEIAVENGNSFIRNNKSSEGTYSVMTCYKTDVTSGEFSISFNLRVNELTATPDNEFASIEISTTDHILLSKRDMPDGKFCFGHRSAEGTGQRIITGESFDTGKWHKVQYVFRKLAEPTEEDIKALSYTNYICELYVNDELIDEFCHGISTEWRIQRVGRFTNHNSYPMFSLKPYSKSISVIDIDNVCQLMSLGTEEYMSESLVAYVDPEVKILSAEFYDADGLKTSYISEGEFYAGLSLTSDINSKITVALASFDLDDNSFREVVYENFNVIKGENQITTAGLYSDGSVYFRLFVWNLRLKPIKPDVLFTTREQCGMIYAAIANLGGRSYSAEVNPETMVIAFDLPVSDASLLENADLSFEASGSVTPVFSGNTFNISAPVAFSVLGKSGESTVYSVIGEASQLARSYDVTGATVYSSEEAQKAWGGSYRAGTPKWISTEKGGGAWFIETDGSDSGTVSIKKENNNDYIFIEKNTDSGNFVLWSGDNKKTGIITKLRTSFKFRVEDFTEDYGQFAGFISGSGDEIVLTGADEQGGLFTLAYRPRGQELKQFESAPVLEGNRWYNLTYVFRRLNSYSVDEEGLYTGFCTEVYLDGEYVGTTQTSSNLPPEYVGYITMKDFSDSVYSQLSLQLHSGATAKIGVDDISVTFVHSEEEIPQTKCGAGQKAFLASYYASVGN